MRAFANGAIVLLMLSCGRVARPQTPPQHPPVDGFEHSLTLEECQVWIALGRSVFRWGSKPADSRQFMIFYRPSGDTYVEQCPWSQLGVTPPPLQKPNFDSVEFFGSPIFEDDHRTAVVSKTIRMSMDGVPGFFLQTENCVLRKAGGKWTLKRCEVVAIT